jgi:signal transduction histidine kinase
MLAYGVGVLLLVGALGFAGAGQGWMAAGAAALGMLSAWSTWRLTGRVRAAAAQRDLLDAQLIQSQKLASLGELSAGIGHEVNNPLAIIAQETEWMTHLLDGVSPPDAKAREDFADSLREIRRQVDRCREITQNLLDFARKMEPILQEVDINRLLEDMTRLVEKETTKNNIAVVREYAEDLPPVVTDPPRIRQVVLNLLNNARHAIQKDGTIVVGTRSAGGGGVEFLVRDTGCGIPREHLNKIFDPFFTTKPQGKGTGLGLSICHGIIERLGGRISVASEVGRGTTFVVHLPDLSGKGNS